MFVSDLEDDFGGAEGGVGGNGGTKESKDMAWDEMPVMPRGSLKTESKALGILAWNTANMTVAGFVGSRTETRSVAITEPLAKDTNFTDDVGICKTGRKISTPGSI